MPDKELIRPQEKDTATEDPEAQFALNGLSNISKYEAARDKPLTDEMDEDRQDAAILGYN